MSIQYTLKENLENANEFNKLEAASIKIFSALMSHRFVNDMSTQDIYALIELSTTLAAGLLDEFNYIRLKTNKYNTQ